eukprot:m.27616 g.27616  ORF g.27616 m.27616 type:complete len:318 (+) comp11763_c0_seq2:77-1030(+)
MTAYDLNLCPDEARVPSIVKECLKFNYKTAALNEPHQGKIASHRARQLTSSNKAVLNRITIILADISDAYSLTGAFNGLVDFDILAALPTTDKLFGQVVDKLECDIITFDFSKRLPFRVKPPQIRQAVSRGMVFELNYGLLISGDSMARRHTLANAQAIVRVTKGHNVILSSGTSDPTCLRSPHDVANLARLFGLSHEQAWAALTTTPRQVVEHARMRRDSHRGVIAARLVDSLPSSEVWRLPVDLTQSKAKAVTAATAAAQPAAQNAAVRSSHGDEKPDAGSKGHDAGKASLSKQHAKRATSSGVKSKKTKKAKRK